MALFNVGQLKDGVSGLLQGLDLNNVTGLHKALERAARTLVQKADVPEASARQAITLYDGVYDYAAPTNIFGGSLIDFRPQGNSRNANDYVYKKGIEQFDRTKAQLPNGYALCVTPETKILMRDFTWKQAGELKIGDPLIGFSEEPEQGKGGRRYLKKAEVTALNIKQKEVFEISLTDGTVLRSTGEHRWLFHAGTGQGSKWIRTDKIKDSMNWRARKYPLYLSKYFSVVKKDNSFEGGFLSAAFDGEGCLSSTDGEGMQLIFTQKDNAFLDKVKKYLDKFEFKYGVSKRKNKERDYLSLHLTGGQKEVYRFLMTFQPPRLLKKIEERILEQKSLFPISLVAVESIKSIGIQEIIAFSSSSQTYIAEGFGSHNTFENNKGTGIVRVASPKPSARVILDNMDVITGWTAAGSASGLAKDETVYYNSPSSLRFTLTGSSTGTLTKTINQIDIDSYEDVCVGFLAVRTPSITNLTSVAVRVGSSASNYDEVSDTDGFLGAWTVDEWLLVAFDFSGATPTGTPDWNAIDYIQVRVAHSGTITNFRVGGFWLALPSPHEMIYQTAAIFLQGGALSKTITDDNTEIVLNDSAYNIYEHECAITIAEQSSGGNLDGVALGYKNKLEKELYPMYKADNPSEEVRSIGSYI